jgi:hypothetical protein
VIENFNLNFVLHVFYDVAVNVGCSVFNGCEIRKYCCEFVFACVAVFLCIDFIGYQSKSRL